MTKCWCWYQVRSQVLRFGGQNTFSVGQDSCFCCLFVIIFSALNKIWGSTKKLWEGTAPEFPLWLRDWLVPCFSVLSSSVSTTYTNYLLLCEVLFVSISVRLHSFN